MSSLKKIVSAAKESFSFEKVKIQMDRSEEGIRMYNYFTSRHPRLFLIKAKTIGIALIKTNDFKNAEDYLQSVNGKNSAAYFSRKATREGYTFKEINPLQYIDAIHSINTSSKTRQGREMDVSYQTVRTEYPINKNNIYYGVFKEDVLVGYLWCVMSGELILFNRLMGHANDLDNGIMYLLFTSTIQKIIDNMKSTKFIMYDTIFLGASDGLKLFKRRLGFKPYKVKWLR